MADYNYTYITVTMKKSSNLFQEIKKMNFDEQLVIKYFEEEISSRESLSLENITINEEEIEKEEYQISMCIMKKWATPKQYLSDLFIPNEIKIEGNSSTYDSDYTIITTSDCGEYLIIDEYDDAEAYVMKLIDGYDDIQVKEDFLLELKNNLSKYKNSYLLKPNEENNNIINNIYKDNIVYICSQIIENQKHYFLVFYNLKNKDVFLNSNKIEIEYLLLYSGKDMSLDEFTDEQELYYKVTWVHPEVDLIEFFKN